MRKNDKDSPIELLKLATSETYVNKSDMKRLIGLKGKFLNNAYAIGLEKDKKEMADRLIYPEGQKIRLTSMCYATGTTLNTLLKQLREKAAACS